ncbi:MAG: hypothetical protein KatS3mg097_156 [Candidatus Parcubacteria bacterium]|nr:MAG: hypothetical protein KatS3mg097_156 [Candidatus Parcubacteria bacterium]
MEEQTKDNLTANQSSKNQEPSQNPQANNLIPLSIILAGMIIALSIYFVNQKNNQTVNSGANPYVGGVAYNNQANNSEASQKESLANITVSSNDHIRGNKDAKITMIEFSDFQCPFCKRMKPTIDRLLNEYSNQIRLVYKHFPLDSIHPFARKAAEASECAGEQGKFWEYHDALFAIQDQGFSLERFRQIATDLKLNTDQFNDCLNSGKYANKVEEDYQLGIKNQVNGTPTTFINGIRVEGAQPFESVKLVIDQLLAK